MLFRCLKVLKAGFMRSVLNQLLRCCNLRLADPLLMPDKWPSPDVS